MYCCGLIEPSSCCLEHDAPPKNEPAIPWRHRQLKDLHQACKTQCEALLDLGVAFEEYQAKNVMFGGGGSHAAFNAEIDAATIVKDEKNNKAFCDTGFVTFHDMATAAAVNTMQILPVPQSVQAHGTPPDVSNLIWSNVRISIDKRLSRQVFAETIVYVVALFWSFWIAACYSLAKYKSLQDLGLLPRLASLPTFVQPILSFVFSILPVALVSAVLSLLPTLLQVLAENFEFIKFHSSVELSVLKRNFFLQMINLWLTILAGSVLSALTEILDHPMKFATYIGATLPSVAVYFVQLVLIKTYISLPLELSRLVPWLQLSLSRLASGGDILKADAEPFLKPQFSFGSNYTTALMVVVILFLYVGISPLVCPFVAAYFVFAYFVYKHNALHVYVSNYDDGGIFVFTSLTYLLGALVGSQITLMGYLLVKEAYYQAAIMLIFPIATYTFSRSLIHHYDPICSRVALASVLKRDADTNAGATKVNTGGIRLVDSFDPNLFRQPIFTAADTEPPALASIDEDTSDYSHLYYQYIDDNGDYPAVKARSYGDDTPLLSKQSF
uniref:CSC1/OSCA1-like 7TM region domain-containing protein n=1 Tax=Aureoumbra lagunensis TaxID=44058 RepID=A0A7S3JMT6_9STRA